MKSNLRIYHFFNIFVINVFIFNYCCYMDQINKILFKVNLIFFVSKNIKVKSKKLSIFLTIAFSNLIVILDVLIIYLFSRYFNPSETFSNLLSLLNPSLLIVIIPFRYLISFIEAYTLQKLRFRIEQSLRLDLLADVYERGNYSIADSYFYTNTLTGHVSQFYLAFTQLLSSLVKVLAFLTIALMSNIQVKVFFTIGLFFLYFPTKYLIRLNRLYADKAYHSALSISKDLERIIDNLYLIKILKKFKLEETKFDSNLSDYYQSQLNNQKYGIINSQMPIFSSMIFLTFGFVFSSFENAISLEFIGIMFRLFQSLGESNKHLSLSTATFVHVEKLKELIKNRGTSFRNNFIFLEKEPSQNLFIKFQNVDFKYVGSEDYIFKNLELDLNLTNNILVSGSNGVGKSTLLGLMSGIFYPTNGYVKTNISKFAYVSAYPMILEDSLQNNLVYGVDRNVDYEDLLNLMKIFKVFEENNKETLEYNISNKSLSSGQMQKVAFIRAILQQPQVLLLDESTSNLDQKSKTLIHNQLSKFDISIVNLTHDKDKLLQYGTELSLLRKESNTIIELIEF